MSAPVRVLVTGARGFVGSTLLDVARREGSDDLELIGVDYEEADLRQPASALRLLRDVQPARVVHLAGKLVKGDTPRVLEEQWEHTFVAGTVVVRAALEVGVHHLVMAGTIDELGSREGALGPADPAEPVSYYGLCKSLLREYAAFFARTGSLRVDWFRPFIVYGPRQTLGAMLLPTAFRAAMRGESAPFSDGQQERDFIHVEDVAAWILLALRIPLGQNASGLHVHHLGTGEPVAVRSVLEAIVAEFPGARLELGALPRRPGEPGLQVAAPYVPAEPSLRSWRPRYGWREGIRQTASWWKQNQV